MIRALALIGLAAALCAGAWAAFARRFARWTSELS